MLEADWGSFAAGGPPLPVVSDANRSLLCLPLVHWPRRMTSSTPFSLLTQSYLHSAVSEAWHSLSRSLLQHSLSFLLSSDLTVRGWDFTDSGDSIFCLPWVASCSKTNQPEILRYALYLCTWWKLEWQPGFSTEIVRSRDCALVPCDLKIA